MVGYANANKNENYEIVSCNDPNKESLQRSYDITPVGVTG